MPATYEPIATVTTTTGQTSISFTSIPGTYTDLRIIACGTGTGNGSSWTIRFNSDSGSNYSITAIYGNGSSATSATESNRTSMTFWGNWSNTSYLYPSMATADIFSYTSAVNKSVLMNEYTDKDGSGTALSSVGLWRSTSTITSISISGVTFAVGATATLYGILKA